MLPTFVIGLREGLEAALIVGIVAAFLRQRGRNDLLRRALLGVAAALVLCIGVGAALQILSANLPQRKQEGLETVVGTVAVVMVTYMVIWMRRHSRGLRGQLEGATAEAVASGSGWALVSMAFLAVLREGFETAVFLLAAFNESDNGAAAGGGAALGIGVAVVLGYGIYRGGVHINLSKFFRATGLVLVLVAAGLVVSALHTAHEAGWLNAGQRQVLDLSSITRPGSVSSSLLSGMLGIQDRPTQVELFGWLLYLIPLATYVAWPVGRAVPRALLRRGSLVVALCCGAAAVLLAAASPSVPAPPVGLTVGAATVSAEDGPAGSSHLLVSGSAKEVLRPATLTASSPTRAQRGGVAVRAYRVITNAGSVAAGQPRTVTLPELAVLNGGRLPLGISAAGAGVVSLTYRTETVTSWWVQASTGGLVDVSATARHTVYADVAGTPTALGTPTSTTVEPVAAERVAATEAARSAQHAAERRAEHRRQVIALTVAALAALCSFLCLTAGGRRRKAAPALIEPTFTSAPRPSATSGATRG